MAESFTRQKVVAPSEILNRDFHLDLFLVGRQPPEMMVLLFGGSGMSKSEYKARSQTIIPMFDAVLTKLGEELSFALAYISAPHDVRLKELLQKEERSTEWTRHAEKELLPAIGNHAPSDVPLYLIGYSGGITLALSGLHMNKQCAGVGGLGADGLSGELEEGPHWREPLRLYYNREDPVYGANRRTIDALEEEELARCFRRLPGGHSLPDYVKNESFSGLIRTGWRLLGSSEV